MLETGGADRYYKGVFNVFQREAMKLLQGAALAKSAAPPDWGLLAGRESLMCLVCNLDRLLWLAQPTVVHTSVIGWSTEAI